ncbi:MAG: hypothetical protein KF797_01565 [Flavobacteriales bacterium]|nr:hypothetical protein [Flavobacteriales bacterium]
MYQTLPNDGAQRRTALVFSVAFHAGILALLLMLKIVTPLPPYPEGGGEGMALGIADIGYSLEGLGEKESMEESGAVEKHTPPPQPDTNEELITEEDGEAINKQPDPVKKPPVTKPVVTKPTPTPPKISEPTVDKRISDAFSNWNKPGKEEGKGGQPGDPGQPDGVKGGGGLFHGNGWELRGPGSGGGNGGGRGLARGPNLSEKPALQNATWVEVMVIVDRQGNVIRTSVANSGTTDKNIKDVAERAAKSCKFVAMPDGPPEQAHYIKLRFFPG